MKKYLSFLLVAAVLGGVMGCKKEAKSLEDYKQEISDLEDSVFTKDLAVKPLQDANAQKLADLYEAYANLEVPDSVAIDALFKAVAINKNVTRSYAKAIQLLSRIYTDYPESPRAATAQFYEAFTYNNDLQDYDTAKRLYDAFLKKYPNDPMAEAVRAELKHLGKTPEQIIQEFENAKR